jgi:DNA-binding CsgD family transcriptional regulator
MGVHVDETGGAAIAIWHMGAIVAWETITMEQDSKKQYCIPNTSILPVENLDRVHRLWDALSEFGATRVDEALFYALGELAALVDAQQAFWLGCVSASDRHDSLERRRSRGVRYLHPPAVWDGGQEADARAPNARDVDPGMIHFGASGFRIGIRNEHVLPQWYPAGWYDTRCAPLAIRDVIYMIMPVGADIESWFGFERIGPDKAGYTPDDRAVMEYAGRPLNWFHRLVCLHHGICLADAQLTPAERRLVPLLLRGGTECSIAKELNLSLATVHTYATRIYRKFNVQGRTGLMALWLGNGSKGLLHNGSDGSVPGLQG